MVTARAGLAALALAGCGGTGDLVLAPVIDTPAPGSAGAVFPSVDELELAVAHAGAADDLASATFGPGDRLELPGVPPADDLVVHLTGRLGGTEVAYGRTCAIAVSLDAAAPSPHLYFARTVTWADRAPPSAPDRRGGGAAAYHDGSAIFVGGTDAADRALTALDRFDPLTGAWSVAAELVARRDGALAELGDGRAVIFGGTDGGGALSSTVELVELDAAAGGRVDTAAEPRLARRGAAAATLADGRVIVFGGADATTAARGDLVEVAADGPTVAFRGLAATLATPRRGATATRLSDDLGAPVVIIGGTDAAGAPVARAELWKPLREAFADPATYRPMLGVPRSGHRAVRLPDGSVLVVGGVDERGEPVRRLELFSADAGFSDAGLLPDGAGVVDATATMLPDGRVLLAGGRASPGGPPVATVLIARLNPLDGSVDVVATDALATARAGHQAALLCDGTVLVVGGAAAAASERYDPPPGGRR